MACQIKFTSTKSIFYKLLRNKMRKKREKILYLICWLIWEIFNLKSRNIKIWRNLLSWRKINFSLSLPLSTIRLGNLNKILQRQRSLVLVRHSWLRISMKFTSLIKWKKSFFKSSKRPRIEDKEKLLFQEDKAQQKKLLKMSLLVTN